MKLTIRTKLLGGFGAVLVLMGVVAYIGYTRLEGVTATSDTMFHRGTIGLFNAEETNMHMIRSGLVDAQKRTVSADRLAPFSPEVRAFLTLSVSGCQIFLS